jgi:hypothetical protein
MERNMAKIDFRQVDFISAKARARLGGNPLGYRQPPSPNSCPKTILANP